MPLFAVLCRSNASVSRQQSNLFRSRSAHQGRGSDAPATCLRHSPGVVRENSEPAAHLGFC